MNEFLKLEYEQCLSLIKYYDERHHSLVKYSSGLSSAVPSLLLAVYQLSGSAVNYFWQFTTIISVVTTIGLLSLLFASINILLNNNDSAGGRVKTNRKQTWGGTGKALACPCSVEIIL